MLADLYTPFNTIDATPVEGQTHIS